MGRPQVRQRLADRYLADPEARPAPPRMAAETVRGVAYPIGSTRAVRTTGALRSAPAERGRQPKLATPPARTSRTARATPAKLATRPKLASPRKVAPSRKLTGAAGRATRKADVPRPAAAARRVKARPPTAPRDAKRRAAAAPAALTRRPSRRTTVLYAITAACLLVLILRVVDIQDIGAAKYAAYGSSELYAKVTIPALRGAIYDRNGNLLAVSVPRVDVVSDDFLVSNPDASLAKLAHLLAVPAASLHRLLTEARGYVTLARQVTPSTEQAIESLGLPNISFVPDPARVDPDLNLFNPLLGQVGFDGTGLSGIEYQQEHTLAGVPGSEDVAVGPGGEALPTGAHVIQAARQGQGLVLTLDQPLQTEVTKTLTAKLKATDAHSGTVVVLDTKTGGILSMVNLVRSSKGVVSPATQNLAVTAEYQAGSVMKLATIGGALQQGIISPDSEFTVPYTLNVGGSTFVDADYHPTQQMPVSQILAQSSNVGTIEIAHLLGPQLLYHYLWDLGYGQRTDLEWPGETPGGLPKVSTWWPVSMGTIPIGVGEAVTAIQVVDAYNAVANGGMYVPPRLVQATVSPSGAEHVLPYAKPHRVLDASTVRDLVPMLELVTQAGTATAAQVPGYLVAGKTGTAQIPGNGGYIPGAWMATFVGFAPAENPQLTAIVVINHPNDYYGGVAAAPVFSTIMRYALRHFDVAPPQP